MPLTWEAPLIELLKKNKIKNVTLFYWIQGTAHLSVAKNIHEVLSKHGYQVDMFDPMAVGQPVAHWIWVRVSAWFSTLMHRFGGKKSFNKYLIDNDQPQRVPPFLQFWREVAFFWYCNQRTRARLENNKTQLIISCSSFVNMMATYLKKEHFQQIKVANVLTDYLVHSGHLCVAEMVDYFLVPNQQIAGEMTKRGVAKKKIMITGIPVSSQFNPQLYKVKKNNPPVILFSCGGGMGLADNFIYFKKLLENFGNTYQYLFLAGQNKNLLKRARALAQRSSAKISIFPYTDKMAKLMAVADLVITKPGGLTVTECIAMKKQLLLINPIPGQEEFNAKFAVENYGAWWANTPEEMLAILQKY